MRPVKLTLALMMLLILPGSAFNDSQDNWGTLYIEKIHCDHTTDLDDDDHVIVEVDGREVWRRNHINGGKTYLIKYEKQFRKSAHVEVTELDFAHNDTIADFYVDTGDKGGSYSIKSRGGHYELHYSVK